MSINSMYGAFPAPGRRWTPQIQVSGENVGVIPPGDYMVDPFLPVIGQDPLFLQGAVVIPTGRFVGVGNAAPKNGGSNPYRLGVGISGRSPITLQEGKNIAPAGMSVSTIYKETNEFMTDMPMPRFKKGFVAEVPYVAGVNGAHGAIVSGDRLTGYFGSTTSTSLQSYLHVGKPVKWTARRVHTVATAASSMFNLPAAIYPGITPRVVALLNGSGGFVGATQALNFSSITGTWQLSLTGAGSATVTTVIYDYGQDGDMIAGEALRVESISSILNSSDFMKWVEYAPIDYLNFPPAAQIVPTTAVGTDQAAPYSDWETPATVTAGSVYRLQQPPVSIWNPIRVAIQGTVVDTQGNATTYSGGNWFMLPAGNGPDTRSFFQGLYHSVNWRTGVIELSANITSVTAIKVSYHYVTDARTGPVLWGQGIPFLTDGNRIPSGQTDGLGNQITPAGQARGVPAHLNLSDVVGALRLYVC